TKHQAPSTKHQEPSTKHQEPSTKNQAPRTKNQEPRTKNQAQWIVKTYIGPFSGLQFSASFSRSISFYFIELLILQLLHNW
ncbi:MAG TPA: hypothetical protein PLS70_10900, partial [Acidobacteriota bacterium]|nr:hypothetical protein [Acidobacteriota bacterium]